MATTKKPMVRIHNIETDTVIDREMNEEEFAQYEADLATQAQAEADRLAAEVAKAASLAKLEALGLTADEIAALKA